MKRIWKLAREDHREEQKEEEEKEKEEKSKLKKPLVAVRFFFPLLVLRNIRKQRAITNRYAQKRVRTAP